MELDNVKLWYIERNPNIKISQNIADTKWIHATYPNFSSGVKLDALKMRLLENKKGKSIGLDSPFKVVIKIKYHKFFRLPKVLICWRYTRF
jgi:hypothetical protein